MPCRLLLVLLLGAGVQCQLRGLFPAILNLASNADITANATCGESGPEMFCKLVEHVPGRIVRNPQCRVCDQNSVNPKERHPITNAIDGTNDWWQSPSIQNGREYHWVTITLDLKQVFQVAYVIIKAANSPRPGNWILERSIDGVQFMPWQYYAISDTECLTRYNVTPRLGPPTYKRDDEVICTSYYSKLVPLEHGEIHTSLINGRPSSDDPSPTLLDFTSARYIRLQLQRIRTLNADLMTLSHWNLKDVDPIVTRRYYYSIKDISVGGMCICYGHARSCPWDEVTKKLQCQCERNTCGESCNECCPGYHQNPWRPGTISIGNKCEKCNCHNKAEDCYYDQTVADRNMSLNTQDQYIGGGVCLNCTQFTAGINCETCIEGYYRPHKVSPYTDDPCQPCECDPFGSVSPVCVVDDNHAKPGVLPGQCQCKVGYTGTKCDQCQFGYKGYPNCVRCNCSLVGSVNDDPCAEQCICKEHVEGENCDQCKAGYYNLQENNPEGCTECFCFGVSGLCDELFWHTTQMTDIRGWHVSDLHGSGRIQPQQDQFDGPHQISINNTEAQKTLQSVYYWEAPHSYLGNKLTSYGGSLRYTVSYDIPVESSAGEMISNVDTVIQGNGLTIGTKPDGLMLQPYKENTTELKLIPENFVDFYTKRPVDRDSLLTVLANVNKLLIRASYSTATDAVSRISSVTLDTATPNVIELLPAVQVEHCECPPGYAGTSCESCIPGYYRVGGTLFGGICHPCECNGHATECDIHGACYGCQHNTTGSHCDQCLPGFYGDPTNGTPNDCQPCACPLTISSNNFSPTCYLSNDEDVICDQCAPGYIGAQCEKCANGYFGNPRVPGGSCVPCDCNGNIDPFEDGHCDSLTGECLRCIGNTAGQHCERCAEGFYGDAILSKNCSACECHPNSSVSAVCHHETGLCECKPHVFGKQCDQCEPGFYGLTSGLGCLPCNCSQSGSISEVCNDAGQCPCVAGVAGDKCDICAHGFYGYKEGGCTPCDCEHTQNNCNPRTGECICPPHTHGPKCEFCDTNYWGHDAELGCLECNCTREGSSRLQCDLTTGQCPCRKEFGGQTCNACLFGYRKYPNCIACDCDVQGTQSAWCDDKQKLCSCEEETGACACKENVVGSYCNECKSGTFALHMDNPLGCSPCYCSGVSQLCAEIEDYVHIPISLVPDQSLLRVVSLSNLNGTTDGVFSEEIDMLLDASVIRQILLSDTFYWRLPEQFLGDKLLAYGGVMTYVITYYALADSGPSDSEPHIIMRGGHLRKLTLYMDKPSPSLGIRSEMKIHMREDKWKYHNSVSDNAVTRRDFMSVLSNIDYILIKASYGYGVQQSRYSMISNISMDIAVEATEMHSGRKQAPLIETCECPPGYTGLSCQECAPGYYRDQVIEINVLKSHPVIAPCVPCECSNHSEVCDPHTGQCMGCRDHTTGHNCHICAPGYYGIVTGSISDCSLCACPKGNSKSFSPTCVLEGSNDFRCDACLPGYEGRHCEQCSLGYFGNPMEPVGSCQLCDCNPNGSLNNDCDRITGQCSCKPGVTGRLCDMCEVRHILLDQQCISCDDDCTGTLLDDVDNLHRDIFALNFTGIVAVPHGFMAHLENMTTHIKESVDTISVTGQSLEKTSEQLARVAKETDRLHMRMTQVKEHGNNVQNSTLNTLNRSQELLGFIEKMQTTVNVLIEVAESLNETKGSDIQLSDSALRDYQEDVSSKFKSMSSNDFNDQYLNATKSLKDCEDLLSKVQSEYERPHRDLLKLKKTIENTLEQHNNRLLAAKDFIQESASNTNHTKNLLIPIQSNLNNFNVKKLTLQENKNRSVMLIEEGLGLVDEAVHLAEDTINATSILETHQEELIMWNTKLRHHVDELVMQMSKRDVLDLVYKAEDHAAGLQNLADSLNSSLSDVRNNSLNATNAVQAHSGIKSMIEQAEAVMEQANNMATEALSTVSGPEGSGFGLGFGSESEHSIMFSSKLLHEAKNLSRSTEGLVSRFKGLKTKVDNIQKRTRAFTGQISEQLRTLRSLPNDTGSKLQDAKDLALSANASAAGTLSHIMNFSQKLTNATSRLSRVNDTLQKTNELLMHSSKTAVTAESRIKEVEAQANILLDRLKPLKLLEENLSRNLSEIKELINQARKQAASIKVAVSADRDCVRSYHPEIHSTNFNTLTLNVKTSEPDNLLFYLGSNTKADFMAVEMRKGKVSFLWDLGTGATRIEEPDIQIDNNKWHKIHATRFGRSGTLSVEEVISAQKTSPKTSSSPGTSSILQVDNSTLMFIGGIGSRIQMSPAVQATDFKGCIGEAFLNGRSIGLWNYVQRQGKCAGCYGSPQDEDTSFYFDGSGYSIVEKTLRSTTTQIFIHFRTFSPNGLLLYLASNGTRDFLSLEIVDGKLRLSVELGSGPLVLTTDGRYNDGTWYKVAFQRNKKQGILAVMDSYNSSQKETKQGEAPGTASDLNRSDKDPIYIGGLPRSRVIRRQLSSRSYVGCIRNLEISRSNFDLLRNAYGVRKGCKLEPTRSITVLNDGYVEMLPVSLPPESEVMVSFSTLNDTGVILAGFGKPVEKRSRRQAQLPFFAIMLVNGHIELHINPMDGASTRKVVVKSPTGTYSDGQEHSLILLRNKRTVSVQVDEGKPAEARLNGPSVESVDIKTSSFFIGGIPAKISATMLKTSQSFYGCIQNLIVNMEQMDFTTVIKYENVQMDSCMLTEKPKININNDEQDLMPTPVPAGPVTEIKPRITTLVQRSHVTKPLQCAQHILPAHVPDAHQFGLTRGSHIILPFDQSAIRRRLSVQLFLRTFASSGLIYYMAHQNQVDYAALQLHDGKLHFLFDMGKGRTETMHSAVINDGKWHLIATEYIKRKNIITVDGQESISVGTPGDSNTLDVEGKLYLGGLPPSYTAKNIGNVTHSIPACISNVTINGKQLDKDGAIAIHAVNKCYASAQEGTYFDGSGFAALVKEGYKVRSDVNISLEFRSTSLNGVLLGISSAKVDAIGLEIVNGRVLFHVNNGAGKITAAYKPEGSSSLCDGKWHQIQANKVKHKIILTVDGNTVQAESPHVQSTSADTNNPIYVGGYPADVKQNCLTSQTSFHGCIKNMKLVKGTQTEANDFSKSFEMRGVFPHSCPGTEL
ncbi:laminin subunit alpha-1 isoform X1 [Dendropsophus ebraccatus]|uniref:laminin subunit alpha-1 isoform X1 n=1 Tax=Dendropsophus ebraccatus TaxID=150705 RepID=UPI003831EDD8